MDIVEKPSPNFTPGRKGYKPEAIVIHSMEGTLKATDSWFANTQSKVSAHYGIGLAGDVHRYVQESDTAWHAGRVNKPSWPLIKKTDALYVNPNFYTVGIEYEGTANIAWTPIMYHQSARLIGEVAARWDINLDQLHVISHQEIYAKPFPGAGADIDRLIALARDPLSGTKKTFSKVMTPGQVISSSVLNIRSLPNTVLPPLRSVENGVLLNYEGYTDEGEPVKGNSTWYVDQSGNWFWSGGVQHV